MLTSSMSSSQWREPVMLQLLRDAWLLTLSSNFLTDWYLQVTSKTSVRTCSRNRFSTAGLTDNDGRPKMLPSCLSVSKELVEKVVLSAVDRQQAYFNRHMPTSDFLEGQGTASMGVRDCLYTLRINCCVIENAHHMGMHTAKICY